MAIIRLQGEKEKIQGVYYEFDANSKPLGEGGMGKVYRGRRINVHTKEIRDVAIKFMFAGLPPNVIQRAEDEANIHIQHDNLVEMMGFLSVEQRMPNGVTSIRYHVVSELLTGVSLSDLLQGELNDQYGKTIPYAKTLYQMYNAEPEKFAVIVIKKVLSGIMALHDAGYIHRDIDPSNIMITQEGKIKLIDFGIAKKVDGLQTHDRNLTTAGQFMGKPQYAAPELIIGDLKNQNKPTDIYAIGVLLYQLVVGHLPFEGPSNVVLNSHLREKMPLKQIKDAGLRKIIEHATMKDCTKRYQSAAEFRAALDSWRPSTGSNIDFQKLMPIIAASILGVIMIVCLIWFLPKILHPGKIVVQDDIVVKEQVVEGNPIPAIWKMLLNPSEAKEGLDKLKKLAEEGNPDAIFIMSRLYAISSGSFTLNDDFVTMQANLEGVISPNHVEAHRLLTKTVELKPKYYVALYELACDLWEPALRGETTRNNGDLNKAKELLNDAYEYAKEAGDPVFVNKISALLRKY